jgi:hypothetical protein
VWIDGTDEEAVKSSFKNCAAELEISVNGTDTEGATLAQSKVVRPVLQWFRDREEADREWLVVIDNADDLGWGIKNVIPKGQRGSIIITSRDNRSPMLIDGGCEQLEVGVMLTPETRTLLLQRLQWNIESVPEGIQQSHISIVQRVGCLALAVDLAGAYISNEPDQEAALMQYIGDYDRHQDELLQDDSVCGLLPTKKRLCGLYGTPP